MPSLRSLLCLAALAVPAFAAPQLATRTTAVSEMPDPSLWPRDLTAPLPRAAEPEPFRNAERLARGLPPRRPRIRRGRPARREPAPSVLPCSAQATGYVQATPADGSPSFYISQSDDSNGVFARTYSHSSALQVQYSTCASTTPANLVTLNALGGYGYLGGVVGPNSPSGDFAAGSWNYGFLVSSSQTDAGPATYSPNAFHDKTSYTNGVETALWTVAADGTLSGTWVNSDSSEVALDILYVTSGDFFDITGSAASVLNHFGTSGRTVVTLKIVPIITDPQ